MSPPPGFSFTTLLDAFVRESFDLGGAPKNQKLLIDVLVSLMLLGPVVVAPFFLLSCLSDARSVATQSISGSSIPPAGRPARVSVIDGSIFVKLVSVGTWDAPPSVASGPVIASVGGGGKAVPSVSGISSNLVLSMLSSISRSSSVSSPTVSDDVQVGRGGGGAEFDPSDGRSALLSVVLRRCVPALPLVDSSVTVLNVLDRCCCLRRYYPSGTKPQVPNGIIAACSSLSYFFVIDFVDVLSSEVR